MSDTDGFDKRYESENFIFKIERPHFGDKDTDVRAKIYGSFKGNDLSAFYSEKKFTSRSLSGFAKDVCRTQDIDEDEYKEEIVSTLLKKKSEIAEVAKERKDYLKENFQDGGEDDGTDTLLNDVVKRIYEHDNPKVEDFADITKFNSLIEANNDLILRQADKLLLTNKGKSKAEKLLGVKKIDDVNAEAEKVLEEGFIKYFLDSIGEVHKGDHELKVWELVSALSAKCSERQINSWAVGASLTGDTPVVVKKGTEWEIQSMRKLSKEFNGQDWKTLGVHPTKLEVVETPVNDVLQHRNRRRLVDIETRSGRELTGTLDHSFLKHENGEVVPVSGEDLEEGDYIPVMNGHDMEDESVEKISEELAYLLGIYLAEGHKHTKHRISITNLDEKVRSKIRDRCQELDLDVNLVSSDQTFSIETPDTNLFKEAKTGSAQKQVPATIFSQPKEVKKEVLKGYFDGDGIDSDRIGYTTKSKRLGLGISLMLSELGIVTTHRKRKAQDWSEDHKSYYYRHKLSRPVSKNIFLEKIGFDREENLSHDRDKKIQQYVDRVPVDTDKIKRFLMSNKSNSDTGRNKIFNNDNVQKTGEIGRKKLEEALNMYDYDNESGYVKALKRNLNSDIFWDKIKSIEKEEEKSRHRVYDIVAGDVPHFLCANGAIVHNSGKGKSHIKRAIVKFLPDEAYEAPNSMSPKAMLYKTQSEGFDVFKGKLLFLDEAEGYDDQAALVLLRGLTDPDEDKFVHEMVKDQNHEELIIEKPVTVWFTSVESIADEQLKNRFILTNPDGSEELDDKVFNHQMHNLHTGQTLGEPPAEVEVVKEAIRIIRQDTAGLTPIVPFEVGWKQKFNRRLYPYFVTLMEIIAKMNYKNRVIKDNYIYVTRADFRLASTIWSALIDTTIAQTDTEALKLIMALPDRKGEAARSSELARTLEGFNTEKVRRKASNLRDTEELQLINVRKEGGKNEYWAGSDRELLLNPEPEIQIDPETMENLLSKTEKGADPMIMNSVNDAEIPVYDELKERQDTIKEQKLGEVNDWTVDLEKDEKKLLRLLEDMSFSTDLNFVVASFQKEKDVTWDLLENLEDKGLIKIYDEDNQQKAKRTQTYRQQREEGKITL